MSKYTLVKKIGKNYRDMGINRKPLKPYINDKYKGFYIYPFNNNLAVNKEGVVIRIDKNKPIPVGKDSNERNYIQTFIIEDGVKRYLNYYPYRLLAYMFVPKPTKYAGTPYSKLEVNHKDGDKTNDNINNLEWVDTKENMQHAYNNDLNKKADKLICKHLVTGDTITFRSITSAAEYFDVGRETLRKKLRDKDMVPNKDYFYYKLVKGSDEYIFILDERDFIWSPIPKEYLTTITKDNSNLEDQIVIINRKTKEVKIVKNKLEIKNHSDIDSTKQIIIKHFTKNGYLKNLNFLLYPYMNFINLLLKNPNKIKEDIKSNDNLYYKGSKNVIICKNIDTGEELYFGTAVEMGKHFNFNPDVLYKRFKEVSYWNYKINNYRFRLDTDMDWPDDFDNSILKDIRTFDNKKIPVLVKSMSNGDFQVYDSIKEVADLFDFNYNTLKHSLERTNKYINENLEISYAK